MRFKIARASIALGTTLASLLFSTPTSWAGYEFTSHTFTPCGVTGKFGPTQTNCRTAYTTTWDETDANFTVASGIQLWVVPATATYRITAVGAKGGNASSGTGGAGASMRGDFQLTEGATIKILVGQFGANDNSSGSGGGGGGTFVTTSTNTPLVIAGGGGGGADGSSSLNRNGMDASITTSGTAGRDGLAAGGTAGSGGASGGLGAPSTYQWSGGGGGGLTGAGGDSVQGGIVRTGTGGSSFTSGGAGGNAHNGWSYGGDGGFGGGAGGSWGPSGGGGYSGGGGDSSEGYPNDKEGGGGGGSFNSGSSPLNITGVGTGDGYVTIAMVITSTSTSLGLAGNVRTVFKGTAIQLTATVDQPGVVTFFANRKRIANCINRLASSTTATCNWRPSIPGAVQIYAELKPSNAIYTSSRSSPISLSISRRSGSRV